MKGMYSDKSVYISLFALPPPPVELGEEVSIGPTTWSLPPSKAVSFSWQLFFAGYQSGLIYFGEGLFDS
jgi:hypothetical protein